MKTSEIPWTCTDASTKQYGRHITGLLYQFYEDGQEPVNIPLGSYTNEEIERIIDAYGYTLGVSEQYKTNIHELYPVKSGPQSANWVIAECIFETGYAPLKTITHENTNDKKAI